MSRRRGTPKTLTKRERKAIDGKGPSGTPKKGAPAHIHCIACGAHLDPSQFTDSSARWIKCEHGSRFASCSDCVDESVRRLADHDRTGRPVEITQPWH